MCGWCTPVGVDPTLSTVWYKLPAEIDDADVLATKWVLVPQNDGSAFIFAIDEWVKSSTESGTYEWRVRFCKRNSLSPHVTNHYLESAQKNNGFSVGGAFSSGMKYANAGDVLGGLSIYELGGEPRLSLSDAQDAVAKYYGVDSTQVFINVQSK